MLYDNYILIKLDKIAKKLKDIICFSIIANSYKIYLIIFPD